MIYLRGKRILALLLTTVMSLSLLTGCGAKPDETFNTLLNEVKSVKSGTVNAEISLKMSKEFIEENQEISDIDHEFSVDTLEGLEAFLDESGNVNLNATTDISYNENSQANVSVGLLDEKMNFVIDKDSIYLEINGLFDILEKIAGDEVGFLKLFLGDYEYIKGDFSSEIEDVSTLDISTYVNKDTVTKDNKTYTLHLGNDFVKSLVEKTEDSEIKPEDIKDSSATLSISKNEKESIYNIVLNVNIENKITATIKAVLTPGTVTIEIPDVSKVLDSNSEDSLNLGVDIEDDENTVISQNEAFEDINIDCDFAVVPGSLDFVLDNAKNEKDAVAKANDTVKKTLSDLFESLGKEYTTDFKEDTDWNSYTNNYSSKHDNYEEVIETYLTDNYASYKLSYSFDIGNKTEVLPSVLDSIKEFAGAEIPKDKVNEWIDMLSSQYKEEYWSMSAYGWFGANDDDFTIYLWDGKTVEISIEKSIME